MVTPKEFRDLVNEEKLTNEIIAQCIYSVNKRAKNYRDSAREQKSARFHKYKQRNINSAKEKMEEYYELKEELLSIYTPKLIHKQHVGKETERVYSYQKSYGSLLKEKEASIVHTNSYYDYGQDREIDFFDYETGKEKYLYFLYYEIEQYSFHSPISENELGEFSEVSVVEIDSNFKTHGAEIKELLSVQFVRKVLKLIKSGNYTLI